jgi:hypothetical protein
MKKTMIIMLVGMIVSLESNAQDVAAANVPSVVLNTLQTKFTNAADLEWEMDGDLFKAEFEIGTRDHKAWIDKAGVIKKHKEDISKNDLPAAIKQNIEKDFKSYRIDDVDKIESDGNVFYQVELDGSPDDRKLLFTPDGKVLENRAD